MQTPLYQREQSINLPHSVRTFIASSKPEDIIHKFLGPVYIASVLPDLYTLARCTIDARIPPDGYESVANVMRYRIAKANEYCHLFATDSGALGTGLWDMEAGDIVCILFGGKVPYILRPTQNEGQYLFMGECYVKGLMQGEAMDMGLPEQKFTLV